MEEGDSFGTRDDGAEDLISRILGLHVYPLSQTTEIRDLGEHLLSDPGGSGLSTKKLSPAENPLHNDNEEAAVDSMVGSSLDQMETRPNNTDGEGYFFKNCFPSDLWGIPIQSIFFLNLVAIIWGTQHAVIKMVIDDNDGAPGAGFDAGTVQNEVSNDNDGGSASGDSAAAYFTLARFGLAALFASPYTPGCRLWVDNLKKKTCWVESTTFDNTDHDADGEEQMHSQRDQENQCVEKVVIEASNSHDSGVSERDSSRLAWKYGAELGIWMFLGYAFQAVGLETTTASRSGFLLYLNVKFVPFFSYFIFGKTIKRNTWISAFLAFAGTAFLVFDNSNADADSAEDGLESPFTVGDLWCIAAAAASAMFILRMEAASKAVTKASELNAASLWVVAVLAFIWTMGVSWNNLTRVTSSAAQTLSDTCAHAIQQTFQLSFSTIVAHPLPLVYLSGVTTTLANFLQSKAQKAVSAERAAIIYAMDPVYGTIFACKIGLFDHFTKSYVSVMKLFLPAQHIGAVAFHHFVTRLDIILGETLGLLGWIGASLIVVAAGTNVILDFGGTSDGNIS